jgi:hypothetical protein
MGLTERRAILAYKEKKFPGWKAQIDAAAGYDLALDVDWDSMALDGQAEFFDAMFDYGYFLPIKRALEAICIDDLGKNALKARVKTLKLSHDPNGSYLEATFDGDTVVLKAKADHVQTENWIDQAVLNVQTTLDKNL